MNAGNATPSSVENIAYETRQRQKRDAKERIAAQVAAYVSPVDLCSPASLFTEVDPPEPFASALERAGVDVHVAGHDK